MSSIQKAWWEEADWKEIGFGIKSLVMTIDPILAERMFAGNVTNRKEKKSGQTRYADDMGTGSWIVNGEPIIFADSGRLLNGQNRLRACMQSGASFPTVVTFGVKERAIEVMDSGIPRKIADALQIRGEKHSSTLSAAASWLWRWENGVMGCANLSPSLAQFNALFTKNAGLRATAEWSVINAKELFGGPAINAMLRYLTDQVDPEGSAEFWRGMTSGAGLQEGSPILVLRNQLKNTGLRGLPVRGLMVAILTIKAWNAFKIGTRPKVFRWLTTEEFPKVFGGPEPLQAKEVA